MAKKSKNNTSVNSTACKAQRKARASEIADDFVASTLDDVNVAAIQVIDEYLMQNLTEFDDKKFANASKEDLKFDDKDDEEKATLKVSHQNPIG